MITSNVVSADFAVSNTGASFSTDGASCSFSTAGSASADFSTVGASSQMSTTSASMSGSVGTVIYGGVEEYMGAYEANALFSEQTFETRNKRMADDFSVHAINYTEASNDSGGVTITIGG